MRLRAEDITPALMVKNEEYWIHYVLRDLVTVFPRVLMIDTGSTDRTVEIAWLTAYSGDTDFILIEEDLGDDAEQIGNCRNVMRQRIETEWMFLVDGDEIWTHAQLEALLALDVPAEKQVVMALGLNLTEKDGVIFQRDKWNADRLFRPSVKWDMTLYPFESHNLYDKADAGQLIYTEAFFWHVRHLRRSSKDGEAFYRAEKRGYYPWDGELTPIPVDWLGELGPHENPFTGESL